MLDFKQESHPKASVFFMLLLIIKRVASFVKDKSLKKKPSPFSYFTAFPNLSHDFNVCTQLRSILT